ncbi:MAG: type I DNA topoisomerase, partial [Armatimonadota bacterium]
AIAWHLQQVLKLDNAKRIQFNEITKSAVNNALENAHEINIDLVNAQQARRILDRLVGYKLSPLLWRKIKKNLSAGRVQSVAVRLICEREREIEAFVPVEYWSITAKLSPAEKEHIFQAKLIQKDGEKIEIHNQQESDELLKMLEGAEYKVSKIKKSQKKRNPPVPFITSTMQQEASRKLNFTAKRTMMVAQQLYEGVEIGSEGAVGLITYMRTDSTRVASEAQEEARQYISEKYGTEYMPEKPRQVARKGAQDAHEAIRPTSVMRHPDQIKEFLSSEQYKLYKLIWQRFLASQMSSAVFDVVSVDIDANNLLFRATGSTMQFEGFMKVYVEGRDEQKTVEDEDLPPLPELSENQILDLKELLPEQHFTEPPPRYTEPTLVRALEEKGIGRPSTYATIISTIQERKYVELEQKKFKPTELGFIVNDMLVKNFANIMDVAFTAEIERELDEIEEGKQEWVSLLDKFYQPFSKDLESAKENVEKVKIEPEKTDIPCPTCGKMMVVRESRFGKFLGCEAYPECKTTMPLLKKLDIDCPLCEDGKIIERVSKNKKVFFGCDKYPECQFVSWDKPTDRICPVCGKGLMAEKKFRGKLTGYKCTNQDCGHQEKLDTKAEEETAE